MEQNMGHIFISYSHKDTKYAHRLADSLQSKGFDYWIDERLDYGSQWPHEIQKQLDTCDAFILVMSPRSFASDWVQSELQRAKRKQKPIFPILLEGDEPWLSVESTQYYDVRGGDFPDAKFYSALKRVVSVSSNSSTLTGLKKSVTPAPVPNAATHKSKMGLAVAVVGLLAVCAIVVVGLVVLPLLQPKVNPTATGSPSSLRSDLALTLTRDAILNSQLVTTLEPTATRTSLPPTFTPTSVPPTATPMPVVVTNQYPISLCCGDTGTQRSTAIDFVIDVTTVNLLQVNYSTATDLMACSDIVLHILWDGVELYSTDRIGPISGRLTTGSIDLSLFVTRGTHTLTISPEGIVGGCNSGTLGGWAGNLIVHTNEFP
jgi:hypothetical protein